MITHRQLLPCTRGLVFASGAKDESLCENCKKTGIRKSYPVKFPDEPYAQGQFGFVCSGCWKKYRSRSEELITPTEMLVFDWYGRDMVAPPNEFFLRLVNAPIIVSIVEYYNKNGFISLRQYETAIAVTENYNETNTKPNR